MATPVARELRTVVNDAFSSNTYLLASESPGRCVVIDPGLSSAAIDAELSDAGWTPEAVLCTHGHFDHVGGAAHLQGRHDVPVYLCAADAKVASMSNFLMSAFKMTERITLPDFHLVEGDDRTVSCAGMDFMFHNTPGHTPGSVAIEVDGMLFSGDSLYANKIALSRLPGENPATLRASLRRLFGRLREDVLVLPGHGRSATLSEIRAGNDELRDFMAAPEHTASR